MRFKIRFPLLILLGLFACKLYAQTGGDRIYHMAANKIKVFGPSGELSMPWCGGVNNPQFAMADLDHNGKNDLIIFERSMRVRTFLSIGTPGNPKFKYEPSFENNFPAVLGYIKLKDYNDDDIPDLWHYGPSGAALCRGYYNSSNQLSFYQCKEIRYKFKNSPGTVNIGINSSDMPDMADVDGDGDIDIITYSQWGNLMTMYRNVQEEEELHNDSVKFQYVDRCWGRVLQIENNRVRTLFISCDNSGLKMEDVSQNKTTGGSHGICLFDADGDGDYDVLDGSNASPEVQFIKNGKVEFGSAIDSMMAQDTMWQTGGKQVHLRDFPLGFWLDIDDDGDKDLLFSPYLGNTENYRCIHYYKNNGSDSNPSFVYQTDTLLINDMIDVGSNAYPTFYDYNKDGKPDLFIGTTGYYQSGGASKSRISYYKNTTVSGQPSYALESTDFLDIGANVFNGIAPAFGDLDGDGKDDMVIGTSEGTLRFYQNTAATKNDIPDWKLMLGNLRAGSIDINVEGSASPLIYDFDKDGNNDLIIGNKSGKLSYYKNTGNGVTGKPALQFITNSLGDVNVVAQYKLYGFSVPYIGKIDNSGTEYLLVGNEAGDISRYAFQPGNTTAPFTRLDSIYSQLGVKEQRAAPAIADIDGDGRYEMAVGTSLGGLLLYEQLFNVNIDEVNNRSNKPKLYPNPAQNLLIVSLESNRLSANATVKIYNSMGQAVNATILATEPQGIRIDISALPQGVYLCTLVTNNGAGSAPFIKK